MSRDIVNNEDIKELVDAFYHQLLEDELLGYIFRDYMELSLQQHLPIMYSFWESVLLGQMSYKGNPILKHIELNKQVNLNEAHFNHWVGMWEPNCGFIIQWRYCPSSKAEG